MLETASRRRSHILISINLITGDIVQDFGRSSSMKLFVNGNMLQKMLWRILKDPEVHVDM
jgi:hypothetical protein